MKTKIYLTIMMAAILLISSCSGDEKILGIGDKVQHDDFFYSIEKVITSNTIGEKMTGGVYYIVTFKVQNDAKRVQHDWKNDAAFVTDENGKVYENNIEIQKLLDSKIPFGFKESYSTKAGTSETTQFIFDIPLTVKQPYLKFRGDFLMGDMFDGNQFKNSKIKLF
jgi:hypothetical protein